LIYVVVQFLHVAGALGMAASYAVEALSLAGLRRAIDGDEARAWLRIRPLVLKLGITSLFLVLGSGIFTTIVGWQFAGWIVVSLSSLVAIAVVGGTLTGIPMARIAPAVERAQGKLTEDLQRGIKSRALVVSMTARVGIMLGIIFLMVRK